MGIDTSATLRPSLTALSVKVSLCALVTPVRLTKIWLPLARLLATEPAPEETVAEEKLIGPRKVTTT